MQALVLADSRSTAAGLPVLSALHPLLRRSATPTASVRLIPAASARFVVRLSPTVSFQELPHRRIADAIPGVLVVLVLRIHLGVAVVQQDLGHNEVGRPCSCVQWCR